MKRENSPPLPHSRWRPSNISFNFLYSDTFNCGDSFSTGSICRHVFAEAATGTPHRHMSIISFSAFHLDVFCFSSFFPSFSSSPSILHPPRSASPVTPVRFRVRNAFLHRNKVTRRNWLQLYGINHRLSFSSLFLWSLSKDSALSDLKWLRGKRYAKQQLSAPLACREQSCMIQKAAYLSALPTHLQTEQRY